MIWAGSCLSHPASLYFPRFSVTDTRSFCWDDVRITLRRSASTPQGPTRLARGRSLRYPRARLARAAFVASSGSKHVVSLRFPESEPAVRPAGSGRGAGTGGGGRRQHGGAAAAAEGAGRALQHPAAQPRGRHRQVPAWRRGGGPGVQPPVLSLSRPLRSSCVLTRGGETPR